MDLRNLEILNRVAVETLGDWWQDDRRNWCAYCGVQMHRWSGIGRTPGFQATRDHVIARAHRGGRVTIPACRECNEVKGSKFLADFLESDYLKHKRQGDCEHGWPIEALWAVAGISAIKTALDISLSTAAFSIPRKLKADHIR